jgi:ribosomal protection tetracycline resistance protein
LPADALGPVCAALVNARAILGDSTSDGAAARVTCDIPAAEWRALEPRLPRLTRGEGDWSTRAAGYAPITSDPPCRPRLGPDPRNRALYHAEIARGS